MTFSLDRRWLRRALFRHSVLLVGVFIVAFPVWVAFVASTVTLPEIRTVPMPLWPGDEAIPISMPRARHR